MKNLERKDWINYLITVLIMVGGLLGYNVNITPKIDNQIEQAFAAHDGGEMSFAATNVPLDETEGEAPLECAGPYVYKYGAWYNYRDSIPVQHKSNALPSGWYTYQDKTAYKVLEFCEPGTPSKQEWQNRLNETLKEEQTVTDILYPLYRGRRRTN